MKLFGAALVAAVACVGSAEAAAPYIRGDAGVSVGGRLSTTIGDEFGSESGDADLQTGFTLGVAVGFALPANFRVEGEVRYNEAEFADSIDSESSVLSGFANVYYDFFRGQKISPFVGIGLGYAGARLQVGDEDLEDLGLFEESISVRDRGFAVQGIAGVGLELTKNTTLQVAYHYQRVQGLFDNLEGETGVDFDSNRATNLLTAGLRFQY